MVQKTIPTDLNQIPAASGDLLIFGDVSNNDELVKNTVQQVVQTGLQANTTDSLPQGGTNFYMTNVEQAKLAGIEPGAEVNDVNQVNGQQGNVNLTMDDIPDGVTRFGGESPYTSVKDGNAATAYAHSQQIGNPHQTTKSDIGLSNVTNEQQLSRTPGNFSSLTEKSDVQFHINDLSVIQDSSDNNNIKKVKNQTNLIWYAGYIQEWQPSINYNKFVIAGSTTYVIRSIVVVSGDIYMCQVSHQSSGNFAADLALGYWSQIGGGSGSVPINISVGSGAPIGSGLIPGDLYIDYTNSVIYIWDGSTWNASGGGGPSSNEFLVTGFDTTAGYADDKIVAGANIVKTVLNPGGNEDLEISLDPDPSINSLTVDQDIDVTNGDVNVQAGDINVDQGDIIVDQGDIDVTNGDINVTNGTINVDNINVDNITIVNPPIGGGFVNDITTETGATYNATTSDDVILADATSNAITINLYTAIGNDKRSVTIKKIDSSTNVVTIDPALAQTIDGLSTYTLNTQWSVITIVSNGTNWFII